MATIKNSGEDKLFAGAVLFSTKVLSLVLGFSFGFFMFIATNWLLIRGGQFTPEGEYVGGPLLQLLSQFFIGYKVSFFGSIIGFAYGFAVGSLSGVLMGAIYNKVVMFKNKES